MTHSSRQSTLVPTTFLAFLLGVLLSVVAAAPPASANPQPAGSASFSIAWSAPKEIHEYTISGGYLIVDLHNDGSVPLTAVSASLDGEQLDIEYARCEAPVEPGAGCRFYFADNMNGVQYPKVWDASMSVTMKSPDGALHVRTDTHRVSVVNDPPLQLFIMQAINPAVDPGQGIGYCRIPNYPKSIPETSNLVSLHSQLLGDLMDAKNAKIAYRDTVPFSCENSWTSSITVAPGESVQDVVTSTVADDDGLTVTTEFPITWKSTKPAPKLKAALAVDQPDLAETGEKARLTLTATNVTKKPVTVAQVSTPEGTVPLSSCQGGPALAPEQQMVCKYTSKEAVKGKPRSTATFEATISLTDGETVSAKATTTFRDVYPEPQVTVTAPPNDSGSRRVEFTVTVRNVSPETGKVFSMRERSDGRIENTTCQQYPTLATGQEWTCTFSYRTAGLHIGAETYFEIWVTLVDDDGTFGTSGGRTTVVNVPAGFAKGSPQPSKKNS
ncbi:hypothetical protein [Austwickia chelonae]|uniref:hypothetical protein n=1 Tax=Austwickia chelonae TaxID=100225 RepID=UPI0013C3137B|nr:hypothetical protein [Austwickia chelonae]